LLFLFIIKNQGGVNMSRKIKAKVLCSTKNMERVEWLKFRQKGIGGSDVGPISGVSKYKSAISIYLDKTQPINEEKEESEAAYWGTQLEDLVAREFSKREPGFKIQKQNKMFQHLEYEFALANIDRLIHSDERGYGILECKTASEYLKEEWADDNLPDSYYLQVQHYLWVLNLDYAYIAVLVGGNKFKYKLVERNDEIINQLVQIESNFWKCVQDKTPPTPDGSDDYSDYIKDQYPNSTQDIKVELPYLKEKIEKIDAIDEKIKELESEKDQLKQQIQLEMKDAEIAFIPVGDKKRKITWKTQLSTKFDSKTLKVEQPDVYEKYAYKQSSRPFKIS
jgi:putative phage-type endonuclease